MNEHTITTTVSVILAFLGIAVLAVVVSSNAQTGSVLKAGGNSVANLLRCALSPITGAACGTSVTSSISFG